MVFSTPVRISTITATSAFHVPFNAQKWFNHVELLNTYEKHAYITYIEYGYGEVLQTRGVKPTSRKKRQCFANQITMLVHIHRTASLVNVKFFCNGSVHMAGLRTLEDGQSLMDMLARQVTKIFDHNDTVEYQPIRCCMINSDRRLRVNVKRCELFELLHQEYPGISCVYEPTIYPAVKIDYMFNASKSNHTPVCACDEDCHCQKVMISIFRSGSVIVSGAINEYQLSDAYAFIGDFVESHLAQVHAVQLSSKSLIQPKPRQLRIDQFINVS
jgi:TATA-box binding protein (TBP) (component of TFIID and TFIIIB)